MHHKRAYMMGDQRFAVLRLGSGCGHANLRKFARSGCEPALLQIVLKGACIPVRVVRTSRSVTQSAVDEGEKTSIPCCDCVPILCIPMLLFTSSAFAGKLPTVAYQPISAQEQAACSWPCHACSHVRETGEESPILRPTARVFTQTTLRL